MNDTRKECRRLLTGQRSWSSLADASMSFEAVRIWLASALHQRVAVQQFVSSYHFTTLLLGAVFQGPPHVSYSSTLVAPRKRRRTRQLVALCLSFAAHLVFVLFLLQIPVSRRSLGGTPEVQVVVTQSLDEALVEVFDTPLPTISTSVAGRVEQFVPENLEPNTVSIVLHVPTVTDASEASSASNGDAGGNDLAGNGGIRGTEFFGVSASGNSFVYVVDVSSSMDKRMDELTGRRVSRLECVKHELTGAIQHLNETQRFQVLLYSDELGFPFDESTGPNLLVATAENKKRFQAWIRPVRAKPGNEVRDALLAAFALNPDAIFLFSDVDLTVAGDDSLVAKAVVLANSERIPINVLYVGDLSYGRSAMEILSASSGGVFQKAKRAGEVVNW